MVNLVCNPCLKYQSFIKKLNDHYEKQLKQFTGFVESLIKQDKAYGGYIRSCICGSYNEDMLFYNIGENYRYCNQKHAHHKRNTTAILIDTERLTYAICCKDVNCDNTF